jgi:BirA family biotin operon repressor/biotin-[acetyl-CoA-carboxylase] ligase
MIDQCSILRDTFVRDVDSHATLSSTNTRAMELAQLPDLTTPLLVITERQTAGRGRGDHAWWSNDGALTFSLVLELEHFSTSSSPLRTGGEGFGREVRGPSAGLRPETWSRVALAAGVAVCDVLADLLPGTPLGLKWPNDVFLAGRKVCGILTEIPASRPPVPQRLVIGVGINVNNSFSTAPPELRQVGVALCDVAERELDRTEVLVHVLRRIEAHLWSLAKADPELPARWRELSLLTDRQVAVQQGSRRVEGRCIEIDNAGALVLDTPFGRQRMFGGTVV